MRVQKLLFPIFFILFFSAETLLQTGCAGMEGAKTSAEVGRLGDYQRKFIDFYSVKDDIRIGEYFMKEQIKEFKRNNVGVDLPKHAALKGRIENIVKKIAANSDIPNLPYEVHIFDRPDIVNAYCMPGGKIGIFSGLFDSEKGLVNLASDDQIAAVIGHEIAHATLRHVTRRLTRLQSWFFLGSVASAALAQGVSADAQYIFDQVFSLGTNLYLPSYSRKYERAADQAGFYYMSRARFDPDAAVAVWKKAASRGGVNSKKTDFFASHPASGVRAKELERWLPEAAQISSGHSPSR